MYNGHGDVVKVVDSNGRVTKDYEYDAFGVVDNENATDINPWRYCGEYYDTETGNIFLRARYYDPSTGSFITEDPVRDGVNWYSYCAGNPVNRLDPSGLSDYDITMIQQAFIEKYIAESINAVTESAKSAVSSVINAPKNTVRSVWAVGAQEYLREMKGYEVSAWMLEHSLQDSPSDVIRGGNTQIAELVVNDSQFQSEFNKIIGQYNGIGELNDEVSIGFNTGDLFYSIHRSNIEYSITQSQDGTIYADCVLTDTYDFTEILTFMGDNSSKDYEYSMSVGSIANDAANISQRTGIINPYDITVNFTAVIDKEGNYSVKKK